MPLPNRTEGRAFSQNRLPGRPSRLWLAGCGRRAARFGSPNWLAAALLLWAQAAVAGFAQQKPLESGGFLEAAGRFYARRSNADDAYGIGIARFQLWSRAKVNSRLSLRGSFDFQLDTHRDVDRSRWFDVSERGTRIPAGAVGELFADVKLGRLDLRLGRQAIRWGRADGFNPTDNLVPYDYLNTLADVRLPATAVRADSYFGGSRLEFAWVPFYTPTRLPLLGQRWFPRLPETATIAPSPGSDPLPVGLTYQDAGGRLPRRTFRNGQWGVRWNQLVPGAEFSFSYFDGFDDIAYFRPDAVLLPVLTPRPGVLIRLNREYYRVRVAGADFASQLGPFGIRGEAAYFDQSDPANHDHLLFVVGLDRTWGDWFVIVQYAGQKVSGKLAEALLFPDLALRSTLLWRIERTIGPSRSFELKGAFRLLDGDFLVQPTYSITLTNRWRFRIGAAVFGGPRHEYLGQFRDNANLNLELRYSF